MKFKKIDSICLFILACFFVLGMTLMKDDDLILGNETSRGKINLTEEKLGNDIAALPVTDIESSTQVFSVITPPILVDSLSIERRLLATFKVNDIAMASAVIFTEGHGAFRYRIGSVLPGGASLIEIGAASVLLEKDGRILPVMMELLTTSAYEQVDANDEQNTETRNIGYFSKFSEEGITFIEQFDLQPVKENFAEGYIIGDKIEELGVDHLGVEPGDIVLSVNGYPVGEYESDYLVWLSFRTTQRASILIRGERGDFTVHYPEDVFIQNPPSAGE